MTVPLEQLNSDIVFQQANLRAERRLGQMKTFSRTPEIKFFGDCNEVRCVTELPRGSMAIAITYRSNRNKVIPRIECPGFIELFHQADGLPMNNFGLYPDLYTRRFVATGRLRPSLSQNRKCWISFNQTLTNWGMQTSNSGSMSIVRFNQRIGNAVALVRYSSVRVA